LTTPPPCFVNTCGSTVTVTYDFVSGTDGGGTPLTAENCTFAYFCSGGVGNNGGMNGGINGGGNGGAPALQGAQIPSDGQSYGTAYCSEIFDGGINGGMNGGIPII
jgi:hypothetical protein